MSSQQELAQGWQEHHRILIDVAYRLLGSLADAEDAVQEAFTRLARHQGEPIEDLRGWLVVVVSRICLDQLASARVRREAYVGSWLPEPFVRAADDPDADPADRITLDDSVRMALLVVLERLSPPERVAFVLHDVFGLRFEEIATVLGRPAPACRQLASRARRHIREDESARFPVDRANETAVAERFLAACRGGDVEELMAVLAPDVVLRADSDGKVVAPHRPVVGREPIIKIVAKGLRDYPGMSMTVGTANGGPALLVRDASDALITVVVFTVAGDQIVAADLIAAPEKLARMTEFMH
jgi:RNA polymerase sigma-70 factor, ECF subfamily